MKMFKTERSWKDLERADKIVLILGVVVWILISTGICLKANAAKQLKQNVLKTEMVKHR